jgi:hypothetical protein
LRIHRRRPHLGDAHAGTGLHLLILFGGLQCLLVESGVGLAGGKPLLVGKLGLPYRNAVGPYAAGGLGKLPGRIALLLAEDVLHLRSNISGHRIVVIGYVSARYRCCALLKIVLPHIKIGLGHPLEALYLPKCLSLEGLEPSHRRHRHVKWLLGSVIGLRKCIRASPHDLSGWRIGLRLVGGDLISL